MKLLILTSRVPWPLEKGDKLRIFHQIKELSVHHEIYLFCLNDSATDPDAEIKLKEYCKEVHSYKLSKSGIVWRLFTALFSSQPFQVKYFHSSSVHSKIQKEINRIKPDHIYAQLIRVSEYVKNIHHIPKTLDYMDALSKGMERRIPKSKGIFKYFLRKESKRLLEYENLIFDYFENKTIISEQDRNLIYHPDQKKIQIIPNGVDTNWFQTKQKTHEFDILFNGNMSYPPNIDCALFISLEILPLLSSFHKSFRFLISGANPVSEIKALHNGKNIFVSGWKNDIRDAYDSADVFMAPMQMGTGLQNKLLEAMAMGLPCITSTLANNALGAKNGEEIMIADNPKEITAAYNRLKNDNELFNRISVNGRKFVEENYDWKSATEKLNKIFSASVRNS